MSLHDNGEVRRQNPSHTTEAERRVTIGLIVGARGICFTVAPLSHLDSEPFC